MPLILFTSKNEASANIAHALAKKGFAPSESYNWEFSGIMMTDTLADSVLSVPTYFDTDYIIVLSSHKSKKPMKAFTVHLTGNWSEALAGGQPRTLTTAYGSKLKEIIKSIHAINDRKDWEVTLEVDHHGPTADIPVIFVEIGSEKSEWNDEGAAEIAADAIKKNLFSDKKYKTVFGIGGGHYPKEFNRIMLESEVAFGHIIPKYLIDTLDEDTFAQAIQKNIETVKEAWIIKNQVNQKQTDKIKTLCDIYEVEAVFI